MEEKLWLDLPDLLPDVPGAEDACVRRLIGSLEGRAGIWRVHVTGAGPAARLCVHVEETEWGRERLLRAARTLAEQLTCRIGHVRWHVLGGISASLLKEAAKLLRSLRGVLEAHVRGGEEISVEYLREQTGPDAILAALHETGIEAVMSANAPGRIGMEDNAQDGS